MKHLDEAIIQAFLDGELSDKLTAQVTQHLSLCNACTHALLEAETEMADLSLAFATEAASPVPTQRIWARIENEIDYLAAKPETAKAPVKSWRQQIAAFLAPSQIAFAGGLAAVVLVSLFGLSIVQQQGNSDENFIAVTTPTASTQQTPNVNPPAVEKPNYIAGSESPQQRQIVKASYAPKPKQAVKPSVKKSTPAAVEYVELPLAEEKDYLDSIAQLSRTVQTSGDFNLQPAFRVEYERNLAMMNQSIKAMQKQARRNPQDENSKRILLASYQNKIDLLNTVTEKSQLMATLR